MVVAHPVYARVTTERVYYNGPVAFSNYVIRAHNGPRREDRSVTNPKLP